MASRPYQSYSFNELYRLYEKSLTDSETLKAILHELGFRHKNYKIPVFRRQIMSIVCGTNGNIAHQSSTCGPKITRPAPAQVSDEASDKPKPAETDRFNLAEIPVNLRKLIARTADIHHYEVKRLAPSLFSEMAVKDQKKIAKIRKKLLSRNEQQENKDEGDSKPQKTGSTAQAIEEKTVNQATGTKVTLTEFKKQKYDSESKLSAILVPNDLRYTQEQLLKFKNNLTVGELNKITAVRLGLSLPPVNVSYVKLAALKKFCRKELQNKIPTKDDISGSNGQKTISANPPLFQEAISSSDSSNTTTHGKGLTTARVIEEEDKKARITSADEWIWLFNEDPDLIEIIKPVIAKRGSLGAITASDFNHLHDGAWMYERYLAAIQESDRDAPQLAISNHDLEHKEHSIQDETKTKQRESRPVNSGETMPEANQLTSKTPLKNVSVPRDLKYVKALVLNSNKNITLEELEHIKADRSGLKEAELNRLLSLFYIRGLKKENKQNVSDNESVPDTESLTLDTPLKKVTVPRKLAHIKAIVLNSYPDLSIAKLKGLRESQLKLQPTELSSLRSFCFRCLRENTKNKQYKNIRDGEDKRIEHGKEQEREGEESKHNDSAMNTPLLRDIPVRGNLNKIKRIITDHFKDITIGELKKIQTDTIPHLKASDIANLRVYCCQNLVNSNLQQKKNITALKATDTQAVRCSEEKLSQNQERKKPASNTFQPTALLADVELPEELKAIREKADLSLPLMATIRDFMGKDEYLFDTVKPDQIRELKNFLSERLVPHEAMSANHNKGSKEAFYRTPCSVSVILNAPPGCGKTYSLVKKLAKHTEEIEDPYLSKKILVLSFTNNAVNEIKKRLQQHADQTQNPRLRYVKVMTFDSFTYRTLAYFKHAEPSNDFDTNIKKLKSQLIAGNSDDGGTLSDFRWLYIDEYQDLVGCRADLVLELTKLALKRKGSVSLLGDPCQQIMNFQLIHRNDTTNKQFIDRFRLLTQRNQKDIELENSYRFQTEEQKERVSRLRKALIDEEQITLKPSHFAPWVSALDKIRGGTAILCPRNIDTQLIADELDKIGTKTYINRGSERLTMPSWLYAIFRTWHQESMSVSLFLEKCRTLLNTNPKPKLNYLTELGVIEEQTINVRKLVDKTESNGGPATQHSDESVILSTVHKAKGLQYPYVLLLNSDKTLNAGSDELFAFYVAVTRAQQQFKLLNLSGLPKLRSRNGGIYHNAECIYLEGIEDMSLPSLLADESDIDSEDFDHIFRGEASYKITAEQGCVYLKARLYSGRDIKLYRLPRLERFGYKKQGTLLVEGIKPTEISTFIYTAGNPRLERVLGPTCMIAMPVFTGLWKYKYV